MDNLNNTTLNITEIFYSLQGEAKEVGIPTVFVRLTGCPLRCNYCDTLKPVDLADWILEKQLNVRLQVQLHKILWGDTRGK